MCSLLLLSLICCTTSNVYTVLPDRDCYSNNTTCSTPPNTSPLTPNCSSYKAGIPLILTLLYNNISLIGSTSERGKLLTAINSNDS